VSAEANTDAALRLSAVGKNYGRIRALDGLNLVVPRGSVFGLVGPNGAGKTSTFSIACGWLRADQGEVDVLGEGAFDAARHRGRVTALPQDSALGRDMTVVEQLTYLGRLQGIGGREIRSEVDRILTLVQLTDRARDRVRTLSHGMLRRVGIGQAFLGDPELVLLDEPTNGLDPRQAHGIREFVASQRGTRTIVVSSHNLHEIETVCDHVALIDRGRVVMAGPISEVTGRNDEVRVVLADGPVPLAAVRAALPGDTVDWDEATRVLRLRFQEKPSRAAEDVTGAALRALLDAGARISTVGRGQSLERKYLEMPAAAKPGGRSEK
jgi:ABC-type multidrug transport system ATPase subunit